MMSESDKGGRRVTDKGSLYVQKLCQGGGETN